MSNITEIKANGEVDKGNLADIKIPSDAYAIGVFDDKMRYVRFDLNTFAEMERIYGSMEAANAALSKGSMIEIRKILWLGLIWNEAVLDEITGEPIKYNITIYQVGGWLTAQNMKAVMANLMSAINGSMPAEDAEEKTSAVPATSLTEDAVKAAGQSPNS